MLKRTIKSIIRIFMHMSCRKNILDLIEFIKEENQRCHMRALATRFGSIGVNPQIPMPNTILNPQYMHIGDNFLTLYNFRIEAYDDFRGKRYSPKITIGNNVIFNTDCHIGCINEIIIGDNVLAASRVFITDHFHGFTDGSDINTPAAHRELTSKGPVIIGDNVWIGEGVAIMPGVTIGKNCIIGANAVVAKSFPNNCVIAGVPGKMIKQINT
jgi:acetyltransferase-like isoleucine patch superfamily enzyme